MPRTTRAALRSKELAEEEAFADAVPLPPTPQKERVPLSEIANNKGTGLIVVDSAENEPVKQGVKKGRKARGAKKGNNRRVKDTAEKTDIEILEDGNQSSASSAAEEAREDLINSEGDKILSVTDDGCTAPSPAANMASEQLKPVATLELDEESSEHQQEGKEMTLELGSGSGQADGAGEDKEDSFVKQITSRSPAKRVSRIEDSVEALDQLEEEIEKVGQAMTPPPMSSGLPPPPKVEESGPILSKAVTKGVENKSQHQNAVSAPVAGESSKPVKRSVPAGAKGIKPKENRASLLRQGIKPVSLARAKKPVPTTNAPPSPSVAKPFSSSASRVKRASPTGTGHSQTSNSSNKVPPAATTNRVSSVTKAPFQPAKSTKAPTQSTFELPGEAISRKKKEQREERLKKEEEEKLSKRSFKARPMSIGHAPEIRMTTATKARLSVAKQTSTEGSRNPSKRPSPLASSVSSLSSIRRSSSLTVPKRSTPLANSTARRAPSRASVSGEPRPAPTAEDLAHQKVKGKEAFSRPKNEIAAREKERREKEEAAKKARIEAAERGRAASREWAEKQKARKAAEAAAKGSASN